MSCIPFLKKTFYLLALLNSLLFRTGHAPVQNPSIAAHPRQPFAPSAPPQQHQTQTRPAVPPSTLLYLLSAVQHIFLHRHLFSRTFLKHVSNRIIKINNINIISRLSRCDHRSLCHPLLPLQVHRPPQYCMLSEVQCSWWGWSEQRNTTASLELSFRRFMSRV